MTWNHTICEVCWFKEEWGRWPVQIRRDKGDHSVDQCCFCGGIKLTRIWIRHDPNDPNLDCKGEHP